jgi:hypothetical protein
MYPASGLQTMESVSPSAAIPPSLFNIQPTRKSAVQKSNPRATRAIHHLDHDQSPSVEAIKRNARAKFGTVIPEGMTITLYRWREKKGGADFHARYLLTDRGGMRIDAGFSAEGGHQTTDIAPYEFRIVAAKAELP